MEDNFSLPRRRSFGSSRNGERTRDEALRASAGCAGSIGMLLAQHDKLSRKPVDQCTPIMGLLSWRFIPP